MYRNRVTYRYASTAERSAIHARVVTFRVRDGNLDEVLRITREVVIPAAERQDGFVAFFVMSDQEASRVVSITMWETEAEMLASERGEFLQEQFSRVIALLRGPPLIERYRVDLLS